jgi:hypothetical protein
MNYKEHEDANGKKKLPADKTKFFEQELIDYPKQEGRPDSVSFKPRGFRDVIWCPYLNEPAFLTYDDVRLDCPNCNHNFEVASHPFICHISKC